MCVALTDEEANVGEELTNTGGRRDEEVNSLSIGQPRDDNNSNSDLA